MFHYVPQLDATVVCQLFSCERLVYRGICSLLLAASGNNAIREVRVNQNKEEVAGHETKTVR